MVQNSIITQPRTSKATPDEIVIRDAALSGGAVPCELSAPVVVADSEVDSVIVAVSEMTLAEIAMDIQLNVRDSLRHALP